MLEHEIKVVEVFPFYQKALEELYNVFGLLDTHEHPLGKRGTTLVK
jgi:hypothetical protein